MLHLKIRDYISIQNSFGEAFRLFYYKNNHISHDDLSKMIVIFNFLSIWGGPDKNNDELMSWEFDNSLMDFFKQKFKICW